MFVVFISLWYVKRLQFEQTRSTFSQMLQMMGRVRGTVFKTVAHGGVI